MEANLHAIADGELSLNDYRSIIDGYVANTTKTILAGNKEKLSEFNNSPNSSGKVHKCPCCDTELKFGRYGWYCECGFSFGTEICGHKMKESDLEDLIAKGTTKAFSFKAKSGNTFKAKLVLDKEEKKTKFEFDNSGPPKKNSYGKSKWKSKK